MDNYIWKLEDLKSIKKNGLKVFTCFSCGGGSSMGYKLNGCEVIGNVEIDPKIMNIYRANHNPKYPFLMGVQEFKNIPNEKLPEELFDLDILDGSPPCSTFSIAGSREKAWGKNKKFREGQAEQVLSDLFFDFLDVVEKLQPKIVIAENVKGLILGNAKGYVKAIADRFKEIGYDVQLFLFNAATMGVPQLRERTFFIARRKDLNFPKLNIKFNEKPILFGEVERTLKERFGRKISDAIFDYWKKCPAGSPLSKVHPKGSLFNYYKCSKNKVLVTITASDGGPLIHYEQPYRLSDEALIKCSSFPLDYNFGNESVKYIVGMSVPPLMMKKVAEEVIKQCFKI